MRNFRFFRAVLFTLCAIMLLASLCGCGAGTPESTVDPSEPVITPASTFAPTPASTPEATVVTTPDSATEMISDLAGEWSLYSPCAYSEILWLTLDESGSFNLDIDCPEWLWDIGEGDPTAYHYTGKWSLSPWVDGGEMPFLVCFTAEESDDPLFPAGSSLGDFTLEDVSLCDGQRLVRFTQQNDGESFMTEHICEYDLWILGQKDDRELTCTRRENDCFFAHIWKSQYGYRTEPGDFGYNQFVVYVDDIELDDEFNELNVVRESVPYIVGEGNDENLCMLSGGYDELFAYGESVYLITTNADGEIIDAVYTPTVPAPDEKTAAEVLTSIDEVRLMLESGMSMLFEGTDTVWSENVRLVALGTDHEEMFVREVHYAVTGDGTVYRYDPIEDYWYWVDPEAMG